MSEDKMREKIKALEELVEALESAWDGWDPGEYVEAAQERLGKV